MKYLGSRLEWKAVMRSISRIFRNLGVQYTAGNFCDCGVFFDPRRVCHRICRRLFLSLLIRENTYNLIENSMEGPFSCWITDRTFFMRRFTWRLFELYIINTTFEGSGHDCS